MYMVFYGAPLCKRAPSRCYSDPHDYNHGFLNIVTMIITYRVTGWQRCIGCLKLKISFRKRATDFRALLQKMTLNAKASYVSTPPCIIIITYRVIITMHMVFLWQRHFISSFSLLFLLFSSSCRIRLNPKSYKITHWKRIGRDMSTSCWFRIEAFRYRN